MSTVDLKPGEAGGGEPKDPENQNLNPDGTPKDPSKDGDGGDGGDGGGSSDPLDDIKDPEVRAEAKRIRAIRRRNGRKAKGDDEDGEEDDSDPDTSKFATKDDLKKLATTDAKKMVPDYVKELWDELTAVPLGGFDPLDAESIAANMVKRHKLYIDEHPDKAPDPSVDLTASNVIPNGNGGGKKQTVNARPLPGYKEPAQPDDWYKTS